MQRNRFVLFHNGGIGDFLMFVFLAEQIWKGGQATHITIVVPRAASFVRGLVESYPYISVVEASLAHPTGFVKLVHSAPTTVIIHPTLGTIPVHIKICAWLLTRGKGSVLIGFKDQGSLAPLLYTKTLTYDTSINYADLMRTVAGMVRGEVIAAPPRLVIEQQDLPTEPYMVFHPGAGISKRRRSFTTEEAVAVLTHLAKEYPAYRVIVSGGPEEKTWIEEVVQKSSHPHTQVLTGVSAQTLAGTIAHSRLFIGTDTGITHLACFVGASVLEVAHAATTHWLASYCPSATVLYRLRSEEVSRTDEAYLKTHGTDEIRPFGRVPIQDVCREIDRLVG